MYRKSGYKNGRRLKLAQMADYLGIYKLSMDIVANHLTCHLTLPQGKYNKIVGDNRKVWHLGYPRGFLELVEKEAEKYAISPYLLLAVIRQESRFDKRAVSPADARGLMQIIPPTANRLSHLKGIRNFNLKQLFEPQVSIAMGAKYFSELLKKYYGQLPMAVGAYNAGPLAMTRWLDLWSALNVEEFIEQVPYRETRKYMRRVLSGYVIYRWLYGGRKRVMSLPEEVYLNYRDNINF